MKTISDEKYESIKDQIGVGEKEETIVEIKHRFDGNVLYASTKTTLREAVGEANLNEADLSEANLHGADLHGAELMNAKFYGRTNSPKTLTKKQVPVFLEALGFIIEE